MPSPSQPPSTPSPPQPPCLRSGQGEKKEKKFCKKLCKTDAETKTCRDNCAKKKCKRKCSKTCRKECKDNLYTQHYCRESCADTSRTEHFCVEGTTCADNTTCVNGTLPDGTPKKDLFCTPPIKTAVCPVSCDACSLLPPSLPPSAPEGATAITVTSDVTSADAGPADFTYELIGGGVAAVGLLALLLLASRCDLEMPASRRACFVLACVCTVGMAPTLYPGRDLLPTLHHTK